MFDQFKFSPFLQGQNNSDGVSPEKEIRETWGQFFVHFFPRKVIFSGKFCGICCGNDLSKLFPRKILIFTDIFGGKIFCGIFRGIFPGKNVRKIGTWMLESGSSWKSSLSGMISSNSTREMQPTNPSLIVSLRPM
jgi:hypothetical protein